MWSINYFGRKVNMTYSTLVQAVMFWGLAAMDYWDWWYLLYPVTSIYMISFSIGIGSTLFPYIAEILPPLGISIIMASQWIFLASFTFLIPIVTKESVFGVKN